MNSQQKTKKPLGYRNKLLFILDFLPTMLFSICGINFMIDAISRGFFDITDMSTFFQTVAITLAWNSQSITYIIALNVRIRTKHKSFLTQIPYFSDFLSIAVVFTPLLMSV